MIEVDLISYCDGNVKDYYYNIYVLKVGDTVVYIGKSLDIYERWFGLRGRLRRSRIWFTGTETLAVMIADNPDWDWKLQLWTVREAAKFCHYKMPRVESIRTMDRVETAMIAKLKPIENRHKLYFEGGQKIPKFIQDYYNLVDETVDQAFDEVFNQG